MKKLILITILLFFNAGLKADYIKAQIGLFGLTGGSKSESSSNGTSFDVDHKGTFSSPLIFTYGKTILKGLSLEVDLGYWYNRADETPSTLANLGSDLEFEGYFAGVNAVFDFSLTDYLNLHVGGGLTFGKHYITGSLQDDSDFAMSIPLFVGSSYILNEMLHLGAEIRYMSTIVPAELSFYDVMSSNLTFGALVTYIF